MDWLTSPEIWAAFFTLLALEVVLNIDNVIFLSIITAKLPPEQQPSARRLGILLALVFRIAFLSALTWLIGLTKPIFELFGQEVSWRDIILLVGGLFLLWKGTTEIHAETEEKEHGGPTATKVVFGAVIVQIVLIDLVFSLDSILTAIGMTNNLPVMIAAVVVSLIIMLAAASPIANFVNRHPSVKMLALAFLLLIGVALVADSMHFDIPRGYLYFAVAFSALVEALNLMTSRKKRRPE
ncbi:MAG: TerC family protein [Alphaproteobacteria bacterium]|nr:TerC family protein [Alphaproteobacteria bacterium]